MITLHRKCIKCRTEWNCSSSECFYTNCKCYICAFKILLRYSVSFYDDNGIIRTNLEGKFKDCFPYDNRTKHKVELIALIL